MHLNHSFYFLCQVKNNVDDEITKKGKSSIEPECTKIIQKTVEAAHTHDWQCGWQTSTLFYLLFVFDPFCSLGQWMLVVVMEIRITFHVSMYETGDSQQSQPFLTGHTQQK